MSLAIDAATHVQVCTIGDLEVERGRAALIDGQQVALFLLPDGTVLGVDNLDPFSGAHVISRGIVGSRGDIPTVASPLHKQVYDLRTGECLETHGKPPAALRVWPVTIDDGTVYVGPPESTGP
ncbi:nitrite reductase small subunit NirD [Microbacterium sp.]